MRAAAQYARRMKYLLAIDGTPEALGALAHTLALARAGLPLELVLANVQQPASLYEVVVAHDPDVLARLAIEAATHALDTAEALVREAGLPCTREVAVGQPGPMLVELAEDHGCDAIVLGATQGPVVHGVLQNSTRPVLLVPPSPESTELSAAVPDA